MSNLNGHFPRKLARREIDWIKSMLPEEKPGYKKYHELLDSLYVIGYGRFEEDNLILGYPDVSPDEEAFFAPVISLGQIEAIEARIQILVHKLCRNQLQVDIVNLSGDLIPENITELRRWSYAHWNPGDVSPATGGNVREVEIFSRGVKNLVLALSPSDKKIWLHERDSGINYIIPVTNFFNELLKIKRNFASRIAGLNAQKIFESLDEFSDVEINNAFIAYSRYFAKVEMGGYEEMRPKKGFLNFLKRKFKS